MRKNAAAIVGLVAALSTPALLAQPRDQEAIAKRLVAAAGVHEGDLVMVWGGTREVGLLEDIAIQTRAAGAHPLVTLWSPRMAHDFYTKVPERYDGQAPAFSLKLAEMLNALIYVELDFDPATLADVPAARRATSDRVGLAVGRTMQDRGVRRVGLGNGIYPTPHNAKLFGMAQPELEKLFWAAVAVEPKELQARGTAVKAVLAAGRELRLTAPNGTDLRMGVAGRPVFVSDGVISPEEAKAGGAATAVWLPAGELMLAPVAGTAEGTLVVDRVSYQGKDVQGLTLGFKAGRVASMSAKGGAFDAWKARYDAAGEGKDAFGMIDIGLNPALQVAPGSRLDTYVAAGGVVVSIGGNSFVGGTNESAYSWDFFLPGATVTVDGKPIVEKGVLKP